MPCEDFPCCGHQPGDCPTTDRHGRQRWRCVECGKILPLHAPSSICSSCLRRAVRRFNDTGEMFPDREDY